MAIPKIKATYSLDVQSVEKLQELARRWGVSKSEALRRLIDQAEVPAGEPNREALQALDELQAMMKLTKADAEKWQKQILEERRAASEHRGR